MVLEIYDAIKNEYSDYSADQLNKIDKKDLMTKDTAMVEYKKR
jgi:phage/plasmid-associated DNA primase